MRIKKRATDYTPEMLPQNRKEVFFDVLKLHFWNMIKLGLVMLLFSLPLHLAAIGEDIITGSIYALIQGATPELQQGGYITILAVKILRAAVSTLLTPVFAVGLAGVLRVVRQYGWGENVFLATDFVKGVRQNWKQIAGLQFVLGLIYTLSLFAQQLADLSTGAVAWILHIPMAVFVLVILPVAGYAAAGIPVYSTGLLSHFGAGLQIYIKKLFPTLLGVLCTMMIYLPLLIPNLYVHIFGRMIATLLTPVALLGWCLFCYNQQDKFINPNQYPELIGKGTISAMEIE